MIMITVMVAEVVMVAEMAVEVVMVAEMVVVAVITRLNAFGCCASRSPLTRRSSGTYYGSQRRHPSDRRCRCSQNVMQSPEEQFSLVWVRFAVVSLHAGAPQVRRSGSLHAGAPLAQPAALPTTRASVRSPPPEAASGAHPLRPPILLHHGTPLTLLKH